MAQGCLRSQLLAATACIVAAANASADAVMLHNGGQVRGELLSADDAPVVMVRTPLGGTVSISQFEIDAVEHRSLLVEEYETRARDVANTVEARWSLAEWCEQNNLKEAREEQLSLLLEVDPEHAAARKALGHVRHQGQWLTQDEWMTSRGYVWHEGKYVTQRAYERAMFEEALQGANKEWFPKVRQWLVWLGGSNPQLAAEARANFKGLHDPAAVPAVVNFFSRSSDNSMRMTGVQLLAQIGGPNSVAPLVRESIYDSEHEVRIAARDAIKPDQHGLALQCYVPELKSAYNFVVNRAAAGIGEVGDKSAVKYLIPGTDYQASQDNSDVLRSGPQYWYATRIPGRRPELAVWRDRRQRFCAKPGN